MDSTMEMFELIKDYCRQQMPAGPYSLWIKDIVCEKFDHTGAVLAVPPIFASRLSKQNILLFFPAPLKRCWAFRSS